MNRNDFTSKTDCFTLANGVKIPCIGYGTWQTPDGETTENCVETALRLGYRHIDTAFAYGNEKSVGAGIRKSGIPREEIFVTTKHWVTERGYEKTIRAVEASLENLGLDYIDLYLVSLSRLRSTFCATGLRTCLARTALYWRKILHRVR